MSSSRDIERYAALFASRTKVMKSSAMRDLMAVTARPEVISLAGGLPDTSTFPPDTFAAVAQRIAAESLRVDPEDMIVTTGGQQVIDLVTKTLIDPGDVVIAEGPTYPGAVPVFCAYQADALPPLYKLDGGVYVMYLGTFSKILSPGIRMGWVVAPPPVLEKINLGKQGADLCTSTLSQLMVQAYFERAPWRDYVDSLTEIYRDRRDAMLDALADHFPRQAEWTRPGGGLFIWATLPDFIDTTDLLARALRDNVAFVPGSAAFLDGRGHSSMRLNFSASDGESIREAIRRIGEVVTEQVELFGTITGEHQAVTPPGADVVQMPTPAARSRRAR